MVVLTAMVDSGLLLVVLVLVMMVLAMLKGFAEIHLHGVVLLPAPTVHHNVMGLVSVALVKHGKLLRRRPHGGPRG